jgi:hypothetical protein
MKKIYKYILPQDQWDEGVSVTMPRGAQLLDAQIQPHSGLCLWALVDLTQPDDVRTFRVFGTGQPLPTWFTGRGYVATFQMEKGYLVFHLFEVTK